MAAKGMFWVSEQTLVDQANTIRRNSWMIELEIEELERKVPGSNIVKVEEARSVAALPDHVGEDVRIFLPEMGAEEQANSLDEEEVVIVMDIAEVVKRGVGKIGYQLLQMCQRRNFQRRLLRLIKF